MFGVGHLGALAFAIELPGVERANDTVAIDLAAVAQVRAHVRAERIEHVDFTVFRAEHDELDPEVLERFDFAWLNLVRIGHLEPSSGVAWNRKSRFLAHGCSPISVGRFGGRLYGD